MRIRFALALGVLAVAFAGVAIGADDPIAERRDIMKKNGAAAKIAVEMIQGKTPYDAAAAAAAMKTLEDDLTVFPDALSRGQRPGRHQRLAGDLEEHGRLQGARGASSSPTPRPPRQRRRKGSRRSRRRSMPSAATAAPATTNTG